MSAPLVRPVAHAVGPTGPLGENTALLAVLAVGGIVSGGLLVFGTIAIRRRRSGSYVLLTAALGALTVKAVLGGLWMVHVLSGTDHHLLEHGMDLAIALLLVGAIYVARSASGTDRHVRSHPEENR